MLDLLDSARIEEFLESWRYLGLDAGENVARIADWLEECSDHKAALQQLEREYTRLFFNAYPHVIVPPYSSVHLDKDRLVWGPSTSEVVKLYTAAGLAIAEDFCDIPDHIAAELEFASHLIGEQQKGEEDSPTPTAELASVEKRFLEGHLFKWAPGFFSRVAECSRVTFYREMGLLAREFIERDAERSRGGQH